MLQREQMNTKLLGLSSNVLTDGVVKWERPIWSAANIS